MAFEPGRPTGPETLFTPTPAAVAVLPPGVVDKLEAIRERADSLHRLLPTAAERSELGTERIAAIQRLKRLIDHPHDGGFGLKDDDVRVTTQQALVDKLTADLQRLDARRERAVAQWQPAARVRTNVEAYLKDGMPLGTVCEDFDGPVPKLNGKETILDGIERLRRRGRELRADLHRIESAPFPSSFAKARMREQVETLARRGTPTVSLLVEHTDREIGWSQLNLQTTVHNTERPAIGFTEMPDALATLAWVHKDALIAKLAAEIDGESDDGAALSIEDRERQAAQVQGDLLAVERDESALVWQAQAAGLPVEHRDDCHVLAILGARLVTVPAGEQRGSSLEYAGYEIVGRR